MTYTCASCGIPLLVDEKDEEKHDEAMKLWGKRGDAPGMVVVCDDCFLEALAAMKLTKGES